MRQKLSPAAWGQPQITDASHLVVFAAKKDFSEADVDEHIAHTAKVRGIPVGTLAIGPAGATNAALLAAAILALKDSSIQTRLEAWRQRQKLEHQCWRNQLGLPDQMYPDEECVQSCRCGPILHIDCHRGPGSQQTSAPESRHCGDL